MEPTAFPYNRRLIWRRVIVKGIVLTLVPVYFAFVDTPFTHWWDYAMLAVGAWYLVEVLRALKVAVGKTPQVIIGDDGIRDPRIGALSIPWSAIEEVRTYNVGSVSGSIFLFADRKRFDTSKLSLFTRYAPLIGHKSGPGRDVFPLAMTPSVALESTVDDVIADIRSRPAAAGIDVRPANT